MVDELRLTTVPMVPGSAIRLMVACCIRTKACQDEFYHGTLTIKSPFHGIGRELEVARHLNHCVDQDAAYFEFVLFFIMIVYLQAFL